MATAKEPELDWYIPLALEMVQAKYSYATGAYRAKSPGASKSQTVSKAAADEHPAKSGRRKRAAKTSHQA